MKKYNVIYTDAGRSEEKPDENYDCTVRATALAFDLKYATAWQVLQDHGRRGAGTGVMYKHQMRDFYEGKGGELWENINTPLCELQKILKRGRFLVHRYGHIFAMIDGVVFDTLDDFDPNAEVDYVIAIRSV